MSEQPAAIRPERGLLMRFLTKTLKRRKICGVIHLLTGATLLIIMFGLREDYTSAQMVFYCVLGALTVLLAIAELTSCSRAEKEHIMDFSPEFAVENEAVLASDPLLTQFRTDCAAFFAENGIRENSAVQNDTTQLYKSVLDRHKRRLDRLGLGMEFRSVRKQYTEPCVQKTECFDGKYAITDLDEQIEAKRRYTRDGKTLFLRTSNQVAHYTVLHARRVGDSDTVICPNCGHEATRENLIDGCDYCGTAFTVEDLGSRISAFSFRDKYDIAHAKYKELRFTYASHAILILFAVLYFFFLFCFTVVLLDDPGSGEAMNPFFWTFTLLGICGCFAALFDMPFAAFYMLVIFPALNISASFKYSSRRKLAALRAQEEADAAFAKRLRAADPLFSVADLLSHVHFELSSVIFAGNAAEINTFACTDLSPYLKGYADVFDYDTERITFTDLKEEDGLRKLSLCAQIRLFFHDGRKVKSRRENIRLQLVRSAACKTRSVCAPSVMRCRNCGSSLSFSEGLVCRYCSARVDLREYDWVIAGFDK